MTPIEFRSCKAALGLTNEELARELEVNERTIRRWQSGAMAINGRVEALTKAMDQEMAELVDMICEHAGEDQKITVTDGEVPRWVGRCTWGFFQAALGHAVMRHDLHVVEAE